ncbi:HNH endonuclease [Rhodovulum sulfidophilum]|uniref:HNH endonuclease n=1 Tax=Rhodovulum sulfidophilum TaxID=35806 RepID=UPI001920A099|nr:HNH endonuclease [Rhodovulum sulfidophilum]MBL3563914.1 HNH endonuclease [Rhodovulum sulfidophilum]
MGSIHDQTSVPDTPEVRSAQSRVDVLDAEVLAIAEEGVLLAASTSPVGGQIADAYSMSKNIAQGNYGWAIVDGIGFIPVLGDAIKGAAKGTKLARAAADAAEALSTAKAALARTRAFARTRAAAEAYWRQIKAKRDAIIDSFRGCKTEVCRKARDADLRKINRMPGKGGTWVDPHGNLVPAGSGYWKPDPGSSLYDALSKHQTPVQGVPFTDGKPDFTGFPPRGFDKTPQVEIEMSGNSPKDIGAARTAYKDATGVTTPRTGGPGTWHHEPDGVTMSYVDADVHTAYQKADGSANSGTPHAGGDSMTRDPVF